MAELAVKMLAFHTI